jgi:hypothetical protein
LAPWGSEAGADGSLKSHRTSSKMDLLKYRIKHEKINKYQTKAKDSYDVARLKKGSLMF